MNTLNKIVWTICAVLLLSGCDNNIPDGYLADTIVYIRNPLTVAAGTTLYSDAPNLGGSSFPVNFEVLEVRNEKGEIDSSLMKFRDLYTWVKPYNNLKDTTLALVQAKREITPNQPTMRILPGSGQLLFTEGTKAAAPGMYKLTLRMSNSAGIRILKDIITINLTNSQQYEYQNQNHNIAATTSGWIEPGGTSVYDTKGIIITPAISTITYNPAGPNKVHLIIKDKNGSPWNWKKSEMVKRGDRPCLEYALPFIKGIFGDTDLTYDYPFAPFPFGSTFTPDGNEWATRFDYRVLSDYVAIDGLTTGKWHCNLVFFFKFNYGGEWTFDLQFPSLTRIPSK